MAFASVRRTIHGRFKIARVDIDRRKAIPRGDVEVHI
jgi:hypothetical protein